MVSQKKCSSLLHEAKTFDLESYLGKWFEIAAFPAIFERGCSNTTAEYSLDGTIVTVTNTCRVKFGREEKVAIGSAKPSNKERTLKVGFPPFEFIRADYIVEFVDEHYKYAIVGSSPKLYLWILARDYRITDDVLDCLVVIARNKGYNTDKLTRTFHRYIAHKS